MNGWSIQKLSDLSSMKSGLGITEANIEKSGNYPCYGGNGLRGFTSEYTHDGKFALIGRQGALCGNVTLVSGRFFASEHAVVVTPKSNTDIVFLSYVLTDMRLNQYSESSAQPGLSVNKVLEIECFVPNDKAEQRAIAAALSDVDAYIAALEKLIAKKRAIKQGAMQELLTGKRRLPGFEGEWVEKPLGDFGQCVRGVSYNPSSDLFAFGNQDSIVLLRANNIVNEKIEFKNVQYVNKSIVSSEQKLLPGDIIIAMSSGSERAIGKTGLYTGFSTCCCVGAFCAIFRSAFNKYIRFLFQSTMYRERLVTVLEGTSINNLNSRIIEGLMFSFPQEQGEITAIAEILSDMDTEIDLLTSKLEKARCIKQGMMSELLTGRIRLIEEDADNGEN